MQAGSRKTILLLEDEPIVAVDLDEIIRDAGYCVATIISTCAGAIDWLQSNMSDFAIIDVELRDGSCHEVAKILHEKAIPFIVFSGSSPLANMDPAFQKGQ